MKYPKFLKKNDTIGICAPSAGVGRKLESFDRSLDILKKQGYQIKETASVRVNDVRSADAKTRAEELASLFLDDSVKFVYMAAGGDFLFETLPYIPWQTLAKHPKWICGASDPTSILYTYTTKYDVATMYGTNAGSYDMQKLHTSLKNNLQMLQGNLPVLHSFNKISSTPRFSEEEPVFDLPSKWISSKKEIHVKGRCIGGCIDVLSNLVGTKYDATKAFLKRYEKDGFIWYFDNFALSAENFYLALLQMQYAGWFKNVKAVILGRVLFPSGDTGLTYEEALMRVFKDIPYIHEADIGHTLPTLSLINGALLDLQYQNKKATLTFTLKK